MNNKRSSVVWLAGVATLLVIGTVGLSLLVQQRVAACANVPLLAPNLLPNADLRTQTADAALPTGWQAAAPGVALGAFAVDGDGRSLQLLGIANRITTPPVPVQPGQSYCFTARTLSDDHAGVAPRVRPTFAWYDSNANLLRRDATTWQPVVLWFADAPPSEWGDLRAAFVAPSGAATLRVELQPSADDRIYLDYFAVRQGGTPTPQTNAPAGAPPVTVLPYPDGKPAAVSFSFDWETAMGGLVHSRSVGDPYADEDPIARGLRMREGITTTLRLFAPYGVRATYYATGYNFLDGNTEREQFMGNPTYDWASPANRWVSAGWQTTPWFAPDPYGTSESDPAWYFGDLVAPLQAAGHDIQSHTFSHFYGGLVAPDDWQSDTLTWNEIAARKDVAPMQSLAFPWSSSAGMHEGNWRVLAALGVTSLTRLSDQAQYDLFKTTADGLIADPHCRPLPAHSQLMACPDMYLTPASEATVIAQLDAIRAEGGMVDLWAHTEEVVTAEQQQTWQRVVEYAATQPDFWIAPLREITDRLHALRALEITALPTSDSNALRLRISNPTTQPLGALTVQAPFTIERVTSSAPIPYDLRGEYIIFDLQPDQTIEVELWRVS